MRHMNFQHFATALKMQILFCFFPSLQMEDPAALKISGVDHAYLEEIYQRLEEWGKKHSIVAAVIRVATCSVLYGLMLYTRN